MIATDTFSTFARRLASTRGYPYIVIAETANPIQDLGPEALYARAEMMISTVIDGLTLPPAEIERRTRDIAMRQIRPPGIVRSSVAL